MDDEQTRRYETVDVNRDGAAVKIALNRPERMNAWSDGLSRDLLAVLRDVAADETVRAVMHHRHPLQRPLPMHRLQMPRLAMRHQQLR